MSTEHYSQGVRIGPSAIEGEGVFATRDLEPGEYVFKAVSYDVPMWKLQTNQQLSNEPMAQVGLTKDGHAYLTPMTVKMNHQKNCNIELHLLEDGWHACTIRRIMKGEELTADYRYLPEFLGRVIEGFLEL